MKNIIQAQDEYLAARRAAEKLWGLPRTVAVDAARRALRANLVRFARTGRILDQMVQDAVDVFELEAAAEVL